MSRKSHAQATVAEKYSYYESNMCEDQASARKCRGPLKDFSYEIDYDVRMKGTRHGDPVLLMSGKQAEDFDRSCGRGDAGRVSLLNRVRSCEQLNKPHRPPIPLMQCEIIR